MAVVKWGVSLCVAVLLAVWTVEEPRVEERFDRLTVKVLSFNIRYGTARDGDNAWPYRKELVYDVIRRHKSDFIGLQEVLRFQIDGIRLAVPGYGEVGVGSEDGEQGGEYAAILYRADRWRTVENGTFWLSDSPNVPGSTSWGNELPRVATWARFVEKTTGRSVWLFNTHFDHSSAASRQKSAELLASRIANRETIDPVVVTGDFNAGEDDPVILYLLNRTDRSPVTLLDTFRELHPVATAAGTFNAYRGRQNGPKIDYVFTQPGARVKKAGIVRDQRNGRYPSDHFPVHAKIALPVSEDSGNGAGR